MTKNIFISLSTACILLAACDNKADNTTVTETQTTNTMARQIKIADLKNPLQNLKDGKTEFDFIGITSNGTDCIYFVKNGSNFVIEFEVMTEEQKPYFDVLKNYAKSQNYNVTLTTYDNKPKYSSDKPAPVIRLETNTDLNKTTLIGADIQKTIFNNNDQTVYDVVP